MHGYIVERTRIYLTGAEDAQFDRLSKSSGLAESHLIREAVDRVYLSAPDREDGVRALQGAAGARRGKRTAGPAYVERLRRGHRVSMLESVRCNRV